MISEKEIKEFWEWCGFKDSYPHVGRNGWLNPNGYHLLPSDLPPIDLNSLFKWAVPKLDYRGIVFTTHTFKTQQHICRIVMLDGQEYMGKGENPVIALFRAIQQVIKE